MKFIYQTIATIIGSFIVQYFLPWWTMAIVACAFGYYFNNKGILAFLSGFIAIALLWFSFAFYLDSATSSILTTKINKLFPVNVFVLMVIVGGLVGGFAALTGAVMNTKKISRYY
ncbi:MAG TPA: hypothetical protein DGG95_15070 [Cytophagales bacterium]|jgi:hypothetical protein|nr:hypothetical protein [Cytophagales bacterium]